MPWPGSPKARLAAGVVLTLVVALGAGFSALASTREELHSVISANMSLRTSLGDMAKAITAKDKEIDRLSRATCIPQSGSPETGAMALRKTAVLKPAELGPPER